MNKLHYENIGGMLVRREGMLHWRCPVCREEGASEQVLSECPHASKHAALEPKQFKLEVGMPIYAVPTDPRVQQFRTSDHTVYYVTKIGRKWVDCAYKPEGSSRHRFDKARFLESGSAPIDAGDYTPREIVYADIEIYRHRVSIGHLRQKIRDRVYAGLIDLSAEKLEQIAGILEIEHEVPAVRQDV